MPFDLSPWGSVRPAIHCNVLIFKFISEKSPAFSIPELGFLFLFQGKRESEAPVGVKIPGCAAGATAPWGRPGLLGPTRPFWDGRKGSRNPLWKFLSPEAVESGRVPAPRAALSPLRAPSSVGRARSAPASAGRRERRRALQTPPFEKRTSVNLGRL